MVMNKILTSIGMFCVLAGLRGMVSAVTNISSCQTISNPSEYVLNQSINSSSTCIKIDSSDVVFNGHGHTITNNNGTNRNDWNATKILARTSSVALILAAPLPIIRPIKQLKIYGILTELEVKNA